MAGILIQGCGIVTMNRARERISCGDIWIEDGKLRHVGAPLAMPPPGADVLDGRGKIAIPGFVNAHHHLFQSVLRGVSPNHAIPQWVPSCVMATTPHFEPDDLYSGSRLSLAECVESGVTTTIDWAFNLHSEEHAAATFQAAREAGVGIHFAYGPSLKRGLEDMEIHRADFDRFRARFFANGSSTELARLWLGLGGPDLQTEEHFREEFELARREGLPVQIHLRENVRWGRPDAVDVLARCGALGPDLLLAHAIHLRDADFDLLAGTGTKVSYNAPSNMRLASGICPVPQLRQRGIDVALGLDGSASNDNNDYFAMMRMALGLQRAHSLRADVLTADDILEMATIGGARCLGQESEIGSLEVGKRADVVLIDPDTLNFGPVNDFIAQLVLCGQPRNVDTVLVHGRVLKRAGELVGVDGRELLGRCRQVAARIGAAAGFPPDPFSG